MTFKSAAQTKVCDKEGTYFFSRWRSCCSQLKPSPAKSFQDNSTRDVSCFFTGVNVISSNIVLVGTEKGYSEQNEACFCIGKMKLLSRNRRYLE